MRCYSRAHPRTPCLRECRLCHRVSRIRRRSICFNCVNRIERARNGIPRGKGSGNRQFRTGCFVVCAICGASVGWKTRAQQRCNRLGFRCMQHRSVRNHFNGVKNMPMYEKLMDQAKHEYDLLVLHLNSAAKSLRCARGAAYRLATIVLQLTTKEVERLVEDLQSQKTDFDTWQDGMFGPVEDAWGLNRERLFADIRAGMTEKDFVKHGERWGFHHRRLTKGPLWAQGDTAAIAPSTLNPEETSRFWEAKAKSQASTLREVERENAILRDDLERAHRLIDRLERRIANLTKMFKTGSAIKKTQ